MSVAAPGWTGCAHRLAVAVVALAAALAPFPARAQFAVGGDLLAYVDPSSPDTIILQRWGYIGEVYLRYRVEGFSGRITGVWFDPGRATMPPRVAYVRSDGIADIVLLSEFETVVGGSAHAAPAKAQPAATPVRVPNAADSLAATCDGRYAVVVGSSTGGTPVASIDFVNGTPLASLPFAGKLARAVAVGDDGRTVLAVLDNASITNASAIRRIALDGNGSLADTGEQLAFAADDYVTNVVLAPGARFGVALARAPSTGTRLVSFAVPGFAPKGSVRLAGSIGNALVFDPSGTFVYTRSGNRGIAPDVIERFAFDAATGALGAAASLTIGNVAGFTGTAFETPLAISPDGARLYAAEESPPRIAAFDPKSGAFAGSATVAGLAAPRTVAAAAACALGFDANQHGISGAWYAAATSGQGFMIEVFRDLAAAGTGTAQVSWFTFDATAGGADRQRWYTLGGDLPARQAASLTIYRNVGGNFNAPPVTAAQPVGSATLRFSDCANGALVYAFSDGTGRAGTIPLTRLTQNVTCAASGTPPVDADFALSGNWYDPATSGQGITVEVNPNSRVLFFAWYTYAPGGAAAGVEGQRWYTGQAAFTAGARTIPLQLYETTGGAFDATAPAPATVVVGTATLAFASCTSATLSYAFTAGSSSGSAGTVALSRVGPVPPGCLP
jgi:hypothetical protein